MKISNRIRDFLQKVYYENIVWKKDKKNRVKDRIKKIEIVAQKQREELIIILDQLKKAKNIESILLKRLEENDNHNTVRYHNLIERLDSLSTRIAEVDQHNETRGKNLLDRFNSSNTNRFITQISNNDILVKTIFNGYLVVPGFNLDVSIGIVRDGIHEPWTTKVILKLLKKGNTYLNVGANFGYYSILAAGIVGRTGKVYSIEANPNVFPYLIRSIYWSGYPDIIDAYNFAAYNSDDQLIDIYYDPQFIGNGNIFDKSNIDNNNIWNGIWNGDNIKNMLDENNMFAANSINASTVSRTITKKLDSIFLNKGGIDLIHMDIEGAEASAILGAYQIILNNPEVSLIIEWDGVSYGLGFQNKDQKEMIQFLKSLRYKIYRIETEKFDGMETIPTLKEFSWDSLGETGHCDLFLTKQLNFEARIL